MEWKTMFGAAVLAGIGFTMSIYISNFAVSDAQTTAYTKIAVFAASFLATGIGLNNFLTNEVVDR